MPSNMRKKVTSFAVLASLCWASLGQSLSAQTYEPTQQTTQFYGYDDVLDSEIVYVSDELVQSYSDEATSIVTSTTYQDSYWDKFANYYYYNQLSSAEKALWDKFNTECYTILTTTETTENCTDYVNAGSLSSDDIYRVACLFRLSNPQYYFLNTTVYMGGSTGALGIYTSFNNGTTRREATANFKTAIDNWIDLVDDQTGDFLRAKEAHDVICDTTTYNNSALTGSSITSSSDEQYYTQSAYSTAVLGTTVCAGYSMAYELILNALDIDAVSVTSGSHQWNKIRVFDSWYNVDCTWDDQDSGEIYTMFMKSDSDLTANDIAMSGDSTGSAHNPSTCYYANTWTDILPPCTQSLSTTSTTVGTLHNPTLTTANPTISVGTSGSKYVISISDTTANACIYYTCDGSQPTSASSKASKYTTTFTTSDYTQVKAMAVCDTYYDSDVTTANYSGESTYTINFNGNGADSGSMSSQICNCDTAVNLNTNAYSKTGYTFQGWATSSSGSAVYYDGQAVNNLANVGLTTTLYAVWKINSYTVNFYKNDGTSTIVQTKTCQYNTNIGTLPSPSRTNYTLDGWYTAASGGTKISTLTKVTADVNYYAHWTYVAPSSGSGSSGSSSGSSGSSSNSSGGSSTTVKTVTDSGIAMYRLYNPNSGEHFYTKNTYERDNLRNLGWKYEGIAWYAPSTGAPVYRLYNPNTGDHHYTLTLAEKNNLVSVGWRYEGIAWYSGGTIPMYRAYNPNATAGSHHYTKDTNEIKSICAAGWRNEGFAWYALK